MIRACVMGSPVSHSLSPRLHGFWLRQYKIDGEYTRQEVTLEQLKGSLEKLAAQGFSGCNLTLPLKEAALPMMDDLDESCTNAGAVNTVVIRNNKMTGYNSDGFGFLESLKAQQPAWDGTNIVIIGTGGAARGIIATLKNDGAKHFQLINRTRAKADSVIKDLHLKNADALDWQDRHQALKKATLLVNCSSLGMAGQPPLELDLSILPKTAVVCDIIYKPRMTPLLVAAKRRGNPVVEGLPMLLHQGRLGFRHWFGLDPAVTAELYNEMTTGVI